MTKLYHSGEPEGWQIPGGQDRKAERVDVPSSPAELAAWLNDRGVKPAPAAAYAFADLALAATGRGPLSDAEIEEAKGAVLTRADVDKVNDGRPPFMPRLDADEIERRRLAMGQCPKCSSAPSTAVRSWIASASAEELRWIRAAVDNQLEEREEA